MLQDGARLLTLTGPGGSGKTRLALEAAASLVPAFKAGVFWVALAPLRDPALVSETIGQILGAKDGLAEHIGEREMLLLIDNLEQVVAAAPELATLVEACPHLRLLITSRERLRVNGEVEYPVAPLVDEEAVDLFCARARLDADDTIRQLCRALDNLPLAIELAAARVSVLSPAQILERLSQRLDLLKGGRDADPRQQTLRATIEWSFALLSPGEQRLFARLAVFAGGCRLEAAEQIADADLDPLQSLVDKSLLRHGEERFWMLETIREFATERLEASGEATELRRRHADFFLLLAEEAEPHLRDDGRDAWADRLEGDHDNLRAALDWLEASAAGDEALRLAGALDEFWCAHEHWPEGRRYLERLLEGMEGGSARVRAKALIGAAHLARDIGDAASATERARAGLEIYDVVGDRRESAKGLFYLGASEADQRDFGAAREHFEQSAQLSRDLGDETEELFANRMLAWAYYELGDRAQAVALHEAQLSRARALGTRDLVSSILGALASYAVNDGRIDDAAPMAAESIRIMLDLDNPQGVATEICRGAAVLARAGDGYLAAELIASALAFHEEAGLGILPYLAEENEKALTRIHSQLDGAAFDEAWEQGRKLSVEDAAALALDALGRLAPTGEP
jgi:predicted ATPase